MANRTISNDELQLLKAICTKEPADENSLSQFLGWTPAHISNMVQTLINPTPGCAYGLVTAKMFRLGGEAVEHASDIRLTPLGKQVCSGATTVSC